MSAKEKKPGRVAPPQVQVKIPIVNLRLEDVAYLRSMDNADGIRCELPERYKNRLRVLRLIETKQVPPSYEEKEKIESELRDLRTTVLAASAAGDWNKVSNLTYDIKRKLEKLKPRPRDVITDKGRELLETGHIYVRMKKVGCV